MGNHGTKEWAEQEEEEDSYSCRGKVKLHSLREGSGGRCRGKGEPAYCLLPKLVV